MEQIDDRNNERSSAMPVMGFTTVRVNVGALIIDGIDDDDIYDDVPVSGKLLLEPMIEPGRPVQVADGGRMKIKAIAPFPVDIGLTGEISYRNKDFVTVPAPTSATSNVAQLQWRATFQDLKYGTTKVTVPPIYFWAEPGLQVDLGDHINIAPNPTAVQLSRGARGFGVVGAVPVEDEPVASFAIEYETSSGTALSDPIPLPEGSGGGLTEQEADTRYAPIGSTGATTVDALTDATTIGKAVAKAASAAAARTAIDAASPAQITTAINGLVNAAPGQLDTLKELSDALGGDQNFASTVTASLAAKAPTGATAGNNFYAAQYPGANTSAKVQAAVADAAIAGGTVWLPGGVITDWVNAVKLPAELPRNVTIRSATIGSTVIRLGTSAFSAFVFDRTAPGLTFRNLELCDFTVDAQGITGSSVGPDTTVATGVTLAANATTAVSVASASTWLASGLAIFKSGAAAAKYFVFTKVNATTLNIRNDGAAVTLAVGDSLGGSIRDHLIVGTFVAGWTIPDDSMSFDRVAVRRIRSVNVPTHASTTPATVRPNVQITPLGNVGICNMTNIDVEDLTLNGGVHGVYVGTRGPANLGIFDHVHVRRIYHDTGVVPTFNYPSANVQIGGSGLVGDDCVVDSVTGLNSGDVGIETDSGHLMTVTDCDITDAFGGAYFGCNFNRSQVGQQTTVNASLGAADATITVTSTAGFSARGWLIIGSELIYYGGTTATAFTGCLRASYANTIAGAAAAASVGAVVEQWNDRGQEMLYIRCRARRKSVTVPKDTFVGFGWYTYRLAGYPAPTIRMVDCFWERNTNDLATLGEAVHAEGGNPRVELTNFSMSIAGTYSTADSAVGKWIYVTQYGSSNGLPRNTLIVKDLTVKARLTLFSSTGYPSLGAIYLDSGAWQLDIDGIAWDVQMAGAFPGSTNVVFLGAGSLAVWGRVDRIKPAFPVGDVTPRLLTCQAPSQRIQKMTARGWDLSQMPYTAGNYNVVSVNAANMGGLVLERIVHAPALPATFWTPAVAVGASPYVFLNQEGSPINVAVSGGTVSDISTSSNGSSYTTTGQTAGTFTVPAGQYLRVTYTATPVMVKQLVPASSPWVYQNLDGVRNRLVVSGGTVSDISVSLDGTNWIPLGMASGPVTIEPGEYLRTTYSAAPTISRQRLV